MERNRHVLISELNDNDVLCGRGGCINAYKGNLQFRTIVSKVKEAYRASKTNREKTKIVTGVVNAIRNMDPPGRFLKERTDRDDGWEEIGDEKAKNKVIQAMRKPKPSSGRRKKRSSLESTITATTAASSITAASFPLSVSILSSTPYSDINNDLRSNFQTPSFYDDKAQEQQPMNSLHNQEHQIFQKPEPRFDMSTYPKQGVSGRSIITSSTSDSSQNNRVSVTISNMQNDCDQSFSLNQEDQRDKIGELPSQRPPMSSIRMTCNEGNFKKSLIRDSVKFWNSDDDFATMESRMSSFKLDQQQTRYMRSSHLTSMDASLISFPGTNYIPADDTFDEEDDDIIFEETKKDENLPSISLNSTFQCLRERQIFFHQKKNEQSSLPPLMLVALSSSKRNKLMESLRGESLMRESVLTLSKMSVDLDPLALEIIANSITSKTLNCSNRSSILSQDLLDELIADLYEEDEIINNGSLSAILVESDDEQDQNQTGYML